MLDLFGEPIADQIDPLKGFDAAWQAYPSGPRRVAKKQAMEKWKRLKLASQAEHIVAHIRHMKTEDCWLRGFHPLFLTYINQERWSEWEQPKPRKEEPSALQQILAHKGAPMPADVRAKLAQLRGRA